MIATVFFTKGAILPPTIERVMQGQGVDNAAVVQIAAMISDKTR